MCNSFKFLGGSALWRGSGWILLCNVSALQLLRASQLQQGEEGEEMQLTSLFHFSSSSLLWPLGQASVDDEAPGERSVSREHSFRIQARPKKQPCPAWKSQNCQFERQCTELPPNAVSGHLPQFAEQAIFLTPNIVSVEPSLKCSNWGPCQFCYERGMDDPR